MIYSIYLIFQWYKTWYCFTSWRTKTNAESFYYFVIRQFELQRIREWNSLSYGRVFVHMKKKNILRFYRIETTMIDDDAGFQTWKLIEEIKIDPKNIEQLAFGYDNHVFAADFMLTNEFLLRKAKESGYYPHMFTDYKRAF